MCSPRRLRCAKCCRCRLLPDDRDHACIRSPWVILLPAWVTVVCVDINPSTVIKLSDRGSFQTMGLVTDVEPFMRTLVREVELVEAELAG